MPKGVYARRVPVRDESALFPADRLFSAHVRASDGCWEWTALRDRKGYGRLSRRGRALLAHRRGWELTNGPIPEGLFVCHHCDNPACVRPDHLFLGTASDNARDCHAKGRARNGRELVTHCKQGHPFDGVNSYIWERKDGVRLRVCRTCSHNKYIARKQRLAAQRN